MSVPVPIGASLDAAGIRVSIADDELVDGVVVVLRVVGSDGRTRVRHAWSEGLDWVTRRGMLEVARDVEVIPADRS